MMLFLRWFLFTLCLAGEIKVRATGTHDLRERPHGCIGRSVACAIQTKESVFHFNKKDFEFHLGGKSTIIRQSPDNIEFVNGTLWVQKYESVKVSTLFAEIESERGPFWVLGDQEKVWIRNVNADLKIQLKDGRSVELPLGFQIWLSGRDEKGKFTMGIPEIIPIEDHLRLWNKMYPGKKEQFLKEVHELKWTWGSLSERASQLYSNITDHQKKIADEREARQRQRRVAQQEENRRVKELYIQKSFWR